MAIGTAFSRESIRFPNSGNIWVPRSSGRAAGAGLSMHSPCKALPVFAQRVLYAAVRVAGPRVLPGVRATWDDPVDADVWSAFLDDWHRLFGEWDSVSLYRRPQLGRSGCALLLLRNGRGVGFVRITADNERARNEFDVMSGVFSARPKTFTVAQPLGFGSGAGWSWLATASVPNYPLGAVRRRAVRARVIDEIADILDGVIEKATPDLPDWRGAHNDLAPWNLRTDLGGRVIVIDWEDAAFAPRGSDRLYADLTAYLTFRSSPPESTTVGAARWVAEILSSRRVAGEASDSINNRLLRALSAVPLS